MEYRILRTYFISLKETQIILIISRYYLTDYGKYIILLYNYLVQTYSTLSYVKLYCHFGLYVLFQYMLKLYALYYSPIINKYQSRSMFISKEHLTVSEILGKFPPIVKKDRRKSNWDQN